MTSVATYRCLPGAVQQPGASGAAIQVQALVPRLGVVAGESIGHDARLHPRLQVLLAIKPSPGSPSGLDVYALFLLCALLPWNFFQLSVMSCMGSLIGNESLIKKTYFPASCCPVRR